jgi:hypothetical protein
VVVINKTSDVIIPAHGVSAVQRDLPYNPAYKYTPSDMSKIISFMLPPPPFSLVLGTLDELSSNWIRPRNS